MQLTHTITVIELVWTITSLIGFVFTAQLLNRAWTDLEWLLHSKSNGDHDLRVYIAHTSVLIFGGGTLTQAAYVAVGIIAMTQPSLHNHPTAASIVTGSVFIGASVLGMCFAAIIYNRRTKAVKLIEEKLYH